MNDDDDLDSVNELERALIRAGRRRAVVASAWAATIAGLTLLGILLDLIWTQAPLVDWWVR